MVEPEVILEASGLSYEIGRKTILDGIDLSVKRGALVAIVGPNGSGKSTLLRLLYRAIARSRGTITLHGRSIDAWTPAEMGRTIGVLRQESALAFDFLVEELVMMGRSPHKRLLDPDDRRDREIVGESLAHCDATHLIGRSFATLSGGEKQRVLLARALAQRPEILLLDEPTNHLDVRHQLDVLACVRRLNLTVIAALHDLNLPFTFATEATLLDHGQVIASGSPRDVLTPDRIKAVFGVEAEPLTTCTGETILAFR